MDRRIDTIGNSFFSSLFSDESSDFARIKNTSIPSNTDSSRFCKINYYPVLPLKKKKPSKYLISNSAKEKKKKGRRRRNSHFSEALISKSIRINRLSLEKALCRERLSQRSALACLARVFPRTRH